MSAGDWIALYAAIVGTGALAWQTTTYLAERRPRLRVALMLIHYLMTEEEQRASLTATEFTQWKFQIEVLNLRQSPARIARIGIETNRRPSGFEFWTSGRWGLPWVLESEEDRVVSLTDDDAGSLKRGQEVRVRVTTTTGKDFFSESLRVGEPGPVPELVMVPEEDFRKTARIVGSEDRHFTMRVHDFDDTPPEADADEP